MSLDELGRPLLSPSAAQTWRKCNRKFGWRYLEGLREPESSGQRLGKAYHRAIESYLLGRLRSYKDLARSDNAELDEEQWRTLKRIVKAVLGSGAYPEPRPGVVVAVEKDLALVAHHASWRGFADAILRPARALEVHDHKTTRSLDYGLTDETLPSDPQAIVYAAAVTHPTDGSTRVGLQWTYVQTHGAAHVRTARCSMTATEAADRMAGLDAEVGAPAVELVRVRPRVLDLAPTWSACDAFGGCPHRERCGERPILAALSAALDGPIRAPGADRVLDAVRVTDPETGSFVQISMPTFLEQYGGGQPAPSAHYTAPPQPQPTAQVQAAPQPAPQPDALASIFGGQPQSAPVPQAVASVAASQAAVHHAPQSAPPALYEGVNRPGGPATAYPDLRAAAGGSSAIVQPSAPSQQTQPTQAPPQYASSPSQQPHATQVPQQPPAQLPAPQAAPAAPQTAMLTQASHFPNQQQVQQPQQPAAPQTQTATGYALLVGGVTAGHWPCFRRVIPVEAMVARAAQILRERHGVEDYRLADYDRGPGMLLLAVQGALLEAQVGQGDALVVSQIGPEWQVVGAALRAQAAGVFQGAVG